MAGDGFLGGGANLDYQAVGLFTYNFTPKFGLGRRGGGIWNADYRGNHQFIYDVAQEWCSLAGLYLPVWRQAAEKVPPTASCLVQPTEVWADEPVKAQRERRAELQPETHRHLCLEPPAAARLSSASTGRKSHTTSLGTWGDIRLGPPSQIPQGKEEQRRHCCNTTVWSSKQSRTTAGGKLFRQSNDHRHWRAFHHHHDGQRSAGMAVDV